MLVLTRYQNQSILIGQDIKIKIVDIARGQVKIGIEAPDEINIVREELLNRNKLVEQE